MSSLGVEAVPPPPSWLPLISSTALVRVRPSPLTPIAVAAGAGVAWIVVVLVGLGQMSTTWVLFAALVGVGALVLAARGNPVVGLLPLLGAAVLWGLATADLLPASIRDVRGDLELAAWNVAFAVTLLAAYAAAVWMDARWQAFARVRDGAASRRWWGADGGEADRQLGLLEAIPAVRFVVASDSTALVLAGRRVAVVRTTTWPAGEYTVGEFGDRRGLLRDGRAFEPGTEEVEVVVADVKVWTERLGGAGAQCRGFVVVHAASDRPYDEVLLDARPHDGVGILLAHEFVEVVGGFLAADPYRLDIAVMQALDERLHLFTAP